MNHAQIRLNKPTPDIPENSTDERKLPATYANSRFLFVHYAAGWMFNEELGFIPELSEIVAMRGVNGIGDDGKLSKAIGGAVQKGGIVINPQDRRLGEWVNYIASFPCVGGGKHWTFKTCEFDLLPGGKVVQRDTSADYRRFLVHLRDAAIVPPMAEAVFNAMIEVENTGLKRLIKAASDNPHRGPDVDRKRARIEAIRAAWAALNTEAAEAAPVGTVGADNSADASAQLAAELGAAPSDGKVRVSRRAAAEVSP